MGRTETSERGRGTSSPSTSRGWEGKETLTTFLAFLASMVLIACSVFFFVPSGADALNIIVAQLLVSDTSSVSPESNERAAYVATIAGAVVILFFIRLRHVSRREGIWGQKTNAVILGLVIAGYMVAHPHDDYRRDFIRPFSEQVGMSWFLMTCFIAFTGFVNMTRFPTKRLRVSLLTIGLVTAALVSFSTMVGSASVKPDASGHFDAVFYSIVQITNGGTCLSDVSPQYGCYGEFLSPFLSLMGGASVSNTTILFALLQTLSLWAIMVFAYQTISRPVLLAAALVWLIVVTNRVFYLSISSDPYFQYWPVRLVFPAVSLLSASYWISSPTAARTALLGGFAGLALWWNTDAGVVVVIALCALVMFGRLDVWAILSTHRVSLAAVFAASAAFVWFSFYLYLVYKSSGDVNLSAYLEYQRVFAGMGFYMLPLPGFPDAWMTFIAVPAVTLFTFSTTPSSPHFDRVSFLAVLSIGVFGYFVGRSHPVVFMLVSWPFAILVPCLIERWICKTPEDQATFRFLQGALACIMVWAGGLVIGSSTSRLSETFSDRILNAESRSKYSDAANFISQNSDGESVGILANQSSLIFSELGWRSATAGPGMNEVLLRADAERIIDQVLSEDGPKDLFIGEDMIGVSFQTWGSVPWVDQMIPSLDRVYMRIGVSPDGFLTHYKRR